MGSNNSVGSLTADMIINGEQAADQLKKLAALGKLTETQLVDITQAFTKAGQAAEDGSKGVKKHNEEVSQGEKELKAFYKEQKFADRTLGESKEALLGFTVGMAALVTGTKGGGEMMEKFEKSVLAGITSMQGAEFSAKALGIAGKDLGGVLGKTAGFLEKNAGAIGVVVGIGAGLITFLRDANDYAKKAAEEGLKSFADKMDDIAGKMEILPKVQAEALRQAHQAELDIVTKELNDLRKEEQEIVEERKKMEEELKSAGGGSYGGWIAAMSSRLGAELLGGDKTTEKFAEIQKKMAPLITRQKELVAKVNGTLITAADPRGKDAKTKSSESRDLDVTALEAIKGMAEYGRARYEAGEITKEQYIVQLKMLRAQSGESKEGLEIQKTINDLLKDDTKANNQLIEQIMALYELGRLDADAAIEKLQAVKATSADILEQAKAEKGIVEIKKLQITKMNEQLDQASRIGNLLSQAFSKSGDDFISKLNQALQIAIQIAKMLKGSGDGKDDSVGVGTYVEIAATILSFFAKASGGGSDTSSADAEAMLGVRASLKRQSVPAGYLAYSGASNAGVMASIRALQADIRNNPPTVIINNPVTLGKALEVTMPEYEKYRKSKVV